VASTDSRAAVIPLLGGLLGAVIGGGASYATAQTANDSENLRFTFTQERSAYVQVATIADAVRSTAVDLLNAAAAGDQSGDTAAQAAASAEFLRFSQAYNEAFFVLADTAPLVELYDAARLLDPEVPLQEYDTDKQSSLVDAFDREASEFLGSAREQVRARLTEAE
jgi:hypothetical protein